MATHKGVLEPSYRKRTAYQAMLLGGMATLVSSILVLGDIRTHEDIELRHAEDLRQSLSQVVPQDLYNNDMIKDTITINDQGEHLIYIARKDSAVTAVAFETTGQGYAGAVTSIIGISNNGKVLGVRVLRHAETPGLGDKIEIKRNPWITSFDGRSLGDPDENGWKVKKDGGIFDQFTGATITPRAVVASVKSALDLYKQHRQTIIEIPVPQSEPETTSPMEERSK